MDNMDIEVEWTEVPMDTGEDHRQERERNRAEREINRQLLQLFLGSLRFFAWAVTLAVAVNLLA